MSFSNGRFSVFAIYVNVHKELDLIFLQLSFQHVTEHC